MIKLSRFLPVPLLVVSGGCANQSYLDPETTGTGAATGIAAQLASEADAVMRLLGFGQVVIAAIVVLAGWAAVRLIHGGVLLSWRMGMDPRRRTAPLRSAANVLITGAVCYLLLRRFLVAAPVITLLAMTMSASAVLLVLAHPIQNVWAGFVLSFRRRIREGDRITIGDQVGIVRDVGLTQLHLRCVEGAAVFVPNRVVVREAVRVEKAKNTVPVKVRVKAPTDDPGPEEVKAARHSALLSPFRAAGTAVDVEVLSDAEMQVVMQVWSERAVRPARRQLELQLRATLAGMSAGNEERSGGQGGAS